MISDNSSLYHSVCLVPMLMYSQQVCDMSPYRTLVIALHLRLCYYGSCVINILHTVYCQYHSSVAALPLVPVALVAIQQRTRDICQYTVCNLVSISLDTKMALCTEIHSSMWEKIHWRYLHNHYIVLHWLHLLACVSGGCICAGVQEFPLPWRDCGIKVS